MRKQQNDTYRISDESYTTAQNIVEKNITGRWPSMRVDPLVRRATPLQESMHDIDHIKIHSLMAAEKKIEDGKVVQLRQGDSSIRIKCHIDDNVAVGDIFMYFGTDLLALNYCSSVEIFLDEV